jgi:hypothetical protein
MIIYKIGINYPDLQEMKQKMLAVIELASIGIFKMVYFYFKTSISMLLKAPVWWYTLWVALMKSLSSAR